MDPGYANQGHIGRGGGVSGLAQMPAPPRAVNPSCFGTLEGATEQAHATRIRIERMADRLSGVVPEAASTDANKLGEPNGLFDAATRQALDISENMRRINAALDRLDSQLP